MAWSVQKFGGTSLADAEGFRRAADRVREARAGGDRVAVVVSATAGTTDGLLRALDLAVARDPAWQAALRQVADRNLAVCEALLHDRGDPVAAVIEADLEDLEGVLQSARLARTAPLQTAELVSGYGELWSARILEAHLAVSSEAVARLDARDVLIVSRDETGPAVHWESTAARLATRLEGHPCDELVVTGYVASDPRGVPTSLGRNGSDFSASIFARLLEATSITIWTDVDGVMSADPRLVPDAVLVPELSFHEAAEMAYFGAAVLHPHTMGPAIEADVPIRIRNARHPERPGTTLRRRDGDEPGDGRALKGVSSSAEVALINLEGMGLIGVPGVAQRFFGALRDVGVSVVLISQAGSEHSICAAVPMDQGERAWDAAVEAFQSEIRRGRVQTVELDGPYRIVAAVGDRMVDTPGVAGRVFGALGAAGVNVRAIAQGASERNISVVVADEDAARAVRATHAAFTLSDLTLSIGLIGPGRVGSELLRQLAAEKERLRERFHIDLRIRGIARSTRMLLDDREIDPSTWRERFEAESEPLDLTALVRHVHAEHLPHAVLVDCTASPSFDEAYPVWLEHGIHVVTANKHATSSRLDLFRRIRRPGIAHYLGEATVGAGLPVIHTLRDLVRTGDRVVSVQGVLSGTLSYLFNRVGPELPFEAAVRWAWEQGYTEPDPRDDLSGADVGRKALILGREMGLSLEPEDVPVESLIPDGASADGGSAEDFLHALREDDGGLGARIREAAEAGEVLRYVASVGEGETRVGIRRYPADHPFAGLRGADNVVLFVTDRYRDRPLVVQGPGAGPAVTAGGLFSDLLRLAGHLGGPG